MDQAAFDASPAIEIPDVPATGGPVVDADDGGWRFLHPSSPMSPDEAAAALAAAGPTPGMGGDVEALAHPPEPTTGAAEELPPPPPPPEKSEEELAEEEKRRIAMMWDIYNRNTPLPTSWKQVSKKQFDEMVALGAVKDNVKKRSTSVKYNRVKPEEWASYLAILQNEGKRPPGFADGGWVGDIGYFDEGGVVRPSAYMEEGGPSGGLKYDPIYANFYKTVRERNLSPENQTKVLEALAISPKYFNPKYLDMNVDTAFRLSQDRATSQGFQPWQSQTIAKATYQYVLENSNLRSVLEKGAIERALNAGVEPEKALLIGKNVAEYKIQQKKLQAAAEAAKSATVNVGGDDFNVLEGEDFQLENYAKGGVVYAARGGDTADHPGGPRGTDTVPAWLTPGEFVVNAADAAANRDILERINSGGGAALMAEGGMLGGIKEWAKSFFDWNAVDEPVGQETEDLDEVIEVVTESLEGLADALVDVQEVIEGVDDGGRGSGGPGPRQDVAGAITRGANLARGVAGGDVAGVAGQLGGAGAAGPVGAVMAVKAAVDAVNEKVIGGIRSAVNGISGIANAIADSSADPSIPLSNVGDAASKAGEKISSVVPALGWMTVAVGETVSALGGFMRVLDKTVERYAEYSPQIAQAQAVAEIRQTMGDLRRSGEVSAAMTQYVMARADLQQKFEDIKVKLLNKIVPIASRILELIEAIMPSGQGIETAINGVGGTLTILSAVAEELVRMIGKATTPEVEDPTSQLLDPRFMMTEGMADARGRPGWIPGE